jgi:hypothetical protein
MNKLFVLCFVTLAAVFIDVVFFHSQAVSAQTPQQVIRIQSVVSDRGGTDGAQVKVTGTVVGFACTSDSNGQGSCFLAVAGQ